MMTKCSTIWAYEEHFSSNHHCAWAYIKIENCWYGTFFLYIGLELKTLFCNMSSIPLLWVTHSFAWWYAPCLSTWPGEVWPIPPRVLQTPSKVVVKKLICVDPSAFPSGLAHSQVLSVVLIHLSAAHQSSLCLVKHKTYSQQVLPQYFYANYLWHFMSQIWPHQP